MPSRPGDYTKALELVDQAIKQMPNESALHEFRGVTLFALGRYTDAAAPLVFGARGGTGLGLGTFISLYPNVSVYTDQLRQLESYCRTNASSAPARFVLAYLYLTQGNTNAAVQIAEAGRRPSAEGHDLGATHQAARPELFATGGEQRRISRPPPVPGGAADTDFRDCAEKADSRGVECPAGSGYGDHPDVSGRGPILWKVDQKGKNHVLQGRMTSGNGLLTLAQDQGPPMVGNVTWADESHFQFKVPGAASRRAGADVRQAQP